MPKIIGIDVGINGAIAYLDTDEGELVIYDMPVDKRNKTSRINVFALHRIIQDLKPVDHVWIEQVNAFGMGATSSYNFGWGCGVVEAVIACEQIPFSYVTPQKWKKALQCPKEKDAARMRATQLLPQYAHNWDLKKHDGRAEAALIAYYGSKV